MKAKSNSLCFSQFMLIVTASSVGEELFYRVAVQVSPSKQKVKS